MIFTILFAFFSAQANWPEPAIDSFNAFQIGVDNQGFQDTYVVSLWGSIRSFKSKLKRFDTVELEVPEHFEKPLKVMYYLQEEKKYRRVRPDRNSVQRRTREPYYVSLKRPLIIYLPGIFNNAKSNQGKRAIKEYSKRGYHIVSIPNPWSEDYIKARPYGTKPGDIISEAKAVRAVMDAAIVALKPENITSIELVGASYGGFLAGVVQALEPQGASLFTATSILAPPLDFSYSLPYMDEQMIRHYEEAEDLSLFDHIKIFFNYVTADFRNDVSETSKRYAKPFTIQKGFKEGLIKAVEYYSKANDVDWLPNFSSKEEEKEWEKNFVFSSYFSDYANELEEVLSGEAGVLAHWLEQAVALGHQVRVLTTENDFLNPMQFPTKSRYTLMRQENFLILPQGGHLGFIAFDWYKNFSEHVWPNKNL